MKKHTTILLILTIALPIIMFIGSSVPSLLISNTDHILKNQIDNPIINSGYDSWECMNIPQFSDVFIPDDWETEYQAGVYKITHQGEVIGCFTIWGTDDATFDSYHNFLATIVDFKEFDYELKNVEGMISIGSSDFHMVDIRGGGGENIQLYRLVLQKNHGPKMVFTFLPAALDHSKLLLVSEAIMYSYFFPPS